MAGFSLKTTGTSSTLTSTTAPTLRSTTSASPSELPCTRQRTLVWLRVAAFAVVYQEPARFDRRTGTAWRGRKRQSYREAERRRETWLDTEREESAPLYYAVGEQNTLKTILQEFWARPGGAGLQRKFEKPNLGK